MAIPAIPSNTEANFDSLSTDILLLILDQISISQDGPGSLRDIRLVSRRLNTIIIPFIYRKIQITPHLVDSRPLDRSQNRTRRKVWANIRTFVKDVYIFPPRRRSFNWNDVVKLLARCRQLESLTYRYRPSTLVAGQQFPKALKNVFETKWHRLRLDMNGYTFREGDFESIPISNVVSFRKLRTVVSSYSPSFTDFLVAAKRLETLHLVDSGIITSPIKGAKLPPIKKLKMSSYRWEHSYEDVLKIWDFSHLETLGFKSSNPITSRQFLRSVRPELLPRLRKFSFLALNNDEVQYNIRKALPNFIAGLKQLEKLSVDCYVAPNALVSAIQNMGLSLRVLKLLDGSFTHKISFSNKQLVDIVQACPKLKLLRLESNVFEGEHFTLYQTLASFHTLQKITISTRINSLTPENARHRAQSYVKSMLITCPGVCMKIERLHILTWNDGGRRDERDWKLQIAMTWNSCGAHLLEDGFGTLKEKPHNTESLGLGGFHYG